MRRSLRWMDSLAFFILALSVGISPLSWAQSSPEWFPIGAPLAGQEPHIQILSADPQLIDIEMRIPGLYREMVTTPGGTFPRLSIPPEGFSTEIGRPQLPVIVRWVEIPAGARVELETIEVAEETFSLAQLDMQGPVAPVQRPVPKIPGAREAIEFEMEENFYARDEWYPQNVAELGVVDQIRGHSLVLLNVYPVRYNPRKEEVSICTGVRLRIHLTGSDVEETDRRLRRWHSPVFEEMLQSSVLNYGRYLAKVVPPLPIGYLVIVHDDYYDQVLPLAQWKEQKGFEVTVTGLSEISPQTNAGIKNYIQGAYDNWAVPPTYVLLVGDIGDIPTFSGSSSTTETDLPYSDMEGSYFPEIELGRFSVSSTTEATAIVDKVLDYEKTNLSTLDLFDEAVFMASLDNYTISEGTHNYVISTYLEPNGYKCHKIYARLGGGTSDITSNINAGRAIANYSGHGNRTSWSNPGFSKTNIDALTNADMYPFVISNACLTSDIGYNECFGEHWVNVANKGGIAHWGSSNYTYWGEDDILEKRMYRAIFEDSLFTLAGMTDQAKWYLYQYYGGGGMSRYYYECYILLGDPSLELPTAMPAVLTVDHPATVPLGPSDVTVTVTQGGSAVEDALVCAMQEEGIREVKYTNVSGQAILSISPSTPDTILVTVTAHNGRPYQGHMVPGETAPPAAVSDLRAHLEETSLSLRWSAVTLDTLSHPKTVTGYVIYRDMNPDFEPSPASSLGTTTTTEYLDATGAVGDTLEHHFYLVLAVDDQGRKSPPSNRVGEFDSPLTNVQPPER
jgi:hypothetical protein